MPRRHGKKIDYTHWTYGSFTSLVQVAGSIGGLVYAAIHEPETLLRLRGSFSAWLDAAPIPGDLIGVAVGLILVPEGTGSTVLWSPITDGDAPWIYYDTFCLGAEEPLADVLHYPGLGMVRRVIDNKAMRIVRNQEVQCVVEQATIGTAQAMNLCLQVRALTGR